MSMIRKLVLLFIVAGGLAVAGIGGASGGNVGALAEGLKAYDEGRFAEAADEFQKLVAQGAKNGPLFYNLGNAYLKAGDLGRAVLWYERAVKYSPRDPDLRFNLAHARSLVQDEKESGGGVLTGVAFFWKGLLGERSIQLAALVSNFFLFLALGLLRLAGRRQVFKGLAVAALISTLLFTPTALYQFHRAEFDPEGVILAGEAPVRSGLSDQAAELFVLHAGTKVEVQDQRDGYVRIAFSPEKIGWIKKDLLGVI
ncbi:MAG: tetratricopeptide repeat protein [Pseudomonadota bacterium]